MGHWEAHQIRGICAAGPTMLGTTGRLLPRLIPNFHRSGSATPRLRLLTRGRAPIIGAAVIITATIYVTATVAIAATIAIAIASSGNYTIDNLRIGAHFEADDGGLHLRLSS